MVPWLGCDRSRGTSTVPHCTSGLSPQGPVAVEAAWAVSPLAISARNLDRYGAVPQSGCAAKSTLLLVRRFAPLPSGLMM
jgi:hypothetical protein